MKVLISNPPAYLENHKRHFIQAGSRWSFSIFVPRNFKEHYLPYPFTLGYSSSLLKNHTAVAVKGFDACALDLDDKDFFRYVQSYDPDILLIEVPTVSFPLVMKLLGKIRQNINCKIVLSGGHVTALAKEIMEEHPFVDYCLLGEYEFSFRDLVEYELGNTSKTLKDVKGLAYRQDRKIIINKAEHQKFNLDDLPYPDRNDFPVNLYHDFEIAGRPSVQMLTSLGCPYKCSFCMPVRVMYQDSPYYRKRSPSRIVDEMFFVKEKYGAGSVYFDDDTFAVDRKRIRMLCDEMTRRGLDLPWTAMGDVTLDLSTLEIMAKSGCVGIKFGVETASTATQKAIRKTFMNIKKVRRLIKWCRELCIWSHATYIIGLPGDRKEDILNTIKLSKELDTDGVQFSIATPFPGTPFYVEARRKGWIVTEDWTMYDGANCSVLSYPWLTKGEIEELHRRSLREWYVNAIIQELMYPRRVLKVMKSRCVMYAVRKTIRHLLGTS